MPYPATIAPLAALIITALVSSSAASEYNCVRGDQAVRRVEVVSWGASQSASCEVVYWKDTEQPGVRNVLWNARTDAKFCRHRAEQLAAALQEGGWFCTAVEGATPEAAGKNAPPVVEPDPVRAVADTVRAAGPKVVTERSEENPETTERNAPAYWAARASEVSEPEPDNNAADARKRKLQGAVLQAIIEENLVHLNERVEGQFTAEIAGYGDLDGDGLEDGLAFFTYEAERLARARFIVAYLYDGESYTLTATKPMTSSDDAVHSATEAIEDRVVSVRLNNPETGGASCCASGRPQQRLHLGGTQPVKVKLAASRSSSDGSKGGATATGATSAGASTSGTPGCLGTFTGLLTKLDQNYGYNTTKIATWPNQARFDAREGKWESYMKGHYAANPDNRRNVAPIQFGVNWGTNIKGAGRTDVWYSNTSLNTTPLCFYGGIVVGTQLEGATWGESKMDGGGYAITINSKNAIVEGMRVHNHHDGFVPYRSDGFTYRGNWQSYTRDDCIENDAGAEGTVTDNLFDGCFVFFSNTGGAAGDAAGSSGTLRIVNNLIKMEPMPGPPFGGAGVEEGDPSITSHGVLFKVQPDFEDTIPQIILRDNVIAYVPSGAKNTLKSLGRIAEHQSTLTSQCSNNTILWLGSGPFPYPIPNKVRKCFNIIVGSQAQQRWQQERQAWINAHPDIPRI